MADKAFEDLTIPEQDEVVLKQISSLDPAGARFGQLHTAITGGRRASERAIDRTLQRLRKRGAIVLVGRPRRWHVKTSAEGRR